MRFVSLKIKFAVLFILVAVVLLGVNTAWRMHVQEEQAEREMLETTHVLATEMSAVWDFMEVNQSQFVKNEDGTYGLYCVVAAKVVAKLFTNKSEGVIIHYTNLKTRKDDDTPDAFEKTALETLRGNPDLGAYYALTSQEDGSKAFRYVEPLYITDSCLQCHGEPAGEIDVMGYPKEGLKKGDIAGAASIIMPANTYIENIQSNMVQETLMFFLLILGGLGVIFWGISRLVTQPVKRLENAAAYLEEGGFDVDLRSDGVPDEIADLGIRFESMAQQLQGVYEGLESEVESRTAQIVKSNEVLDRQRRELEAMNRILQKDNRLKSDFLAMMSHEIRTPLTSILAFADIWADKNTPRNEGEEQIMEEMRINSQVLLSMVNNMLDLARVEAGRLELMPEPIDVVDVLNAIKRSLSFLAKRKNVSLDIEIGRDVPVVAADQEKLRRIVENLVSNAIKYVAVGGRVSVTVTYDYGSNRLGIVVSDNGCGISEEDILLVFDRFVRGSASKQSSGSGLGLALVKELVDFYGGTIEVASEVGRGSLFTVQLPVKPLGIDDEME
ncbi:MAG: DUF3365 domain-containing protein [Raoultibacter sp.]